MRQKRLVKFLTSLLVAALAFGIIAPVLESRKKTKAQSFLFEQVVKAKQMANLLILAEVDDGEYPNELKGLIDSGSISKEVYNELQFRCSKEGGPLEWLYRRPSDIGDVVLVSPTYLKPWHGGSGRYIVACSDGSVRVETEGEISDEVAEILAEQDVAAEPRRAGG